MLGVVDSGYSNVPSKSSTKLSKFIDIKVNSVLFIYLLIIMVVESTQCLPAYIISSLVIILHQWAF
jgi:hypothetical protein